jgi:hypothetical protein
LCLELFDCMQGKCDPYTPGHIWSLFSSPCTIVQNGCRISRCRITQNVSRLANAGASCIKVAARCDECRVTHWRNSWPDHMGSRCSDVLQGLCSLSISVRMSWGSLWPISCTSIPNVDTSTRIHYSLSPKCGYPLPTPRLDLSDVTMCTFMTHEEALDIVLL